MKKIIIIILCVILTSCTTVYRTGDQSFMMYDKEENEYYTVEHLSDQVDTIIIEKDLIQILIVGQDPIIMDVTYHSNITSERDGEVVNAKLYDGLVDGKECRVVVVKDKNYIGYYHTYNPDINFYSYLVVFRILKKC